MFSLRSVVAGSAVVILGLMAGCAENSTADVSSKLMSVEIGMSRSQVLATVGEPQRKENYGATEFLIYSTGSSSFDVLPIAIVDGRVTGIGRNLYDNVVRSKMKSDLDDNLPKKKSN